MELGVVVPAYRPDPEQLVTYIGEIVDELDPERVRIELDDPDGTVRRELSPPPTVVVNAVDRRRGKGAAITAGFEALDTAAVAFVDADGSTPTAGLASVVEPVVAGDAGVSVGSRRHPDAAVTSHQTLVRRLLGNGFAWLARRALDVRLFDYQCGAKALSADAWRAVREHLYEPGFAWDIELVAVADALGYRVAEVPVEWEDRPGSTVDPVTDSWRLARGLLVARHRARVLRGDRLHAAIADRQDGTAALVETPAPNAVDD